MNYKKFWAAASAALMIVIVITLMLAPGAWAQSKYKTLYKFKGGKDGNQPRASLVLDAAGNLYGTTFAGGNQSLLCPNPNSECGTAFTLTPNSNGSWSEKVVHTFCSVTNCSDGSNPQAGLISDQAGNLYGTTYSGGGGYGGGTVFKLAPSADGSWTESVLYTFCSLTHCSDGAGPAVGLIFDQGNVYGTTWAGGAQSYGVVFKLTPNSDGTWTESVLYSFCSLTNCGDGRNPFPGLIFDSAGNLYGTTWGGNVSYCNDAGCGTVFKLTPNADGSWKESVLHTFCSFKNCHDGEHPYAGLIFDTAGNLYGTTNWGGAYNGNGNVFKLTPNANGTWTETVLHQFTGGKDGGVPMAGVVFDTTGNLYGTTTEGGAHGYGVVFKLTPNLNGGWHETVLHDFLDHPGAYPWAAPIFDAAGNLYGTTYGDGTTTHGSVFEITP